MVSGIPLFIGLFTQNGGSLYVVCWVPRTGKLLASCRKWFVRLFNYNFPASSELSEYQLHEAAFI